MAAYPDWEVGDIVTADKLTAGLTWQNYKTSGTSRTSTTTYADDPDLVTFTLATNGLYFVEFFIRYAALNAAKIKIRWTVPAGLTTANRDVMGSGSTANDANADNVASQWGVRGYATDVVYGTRDSASNQLHAYESGVVGMGSTAGTVALSWAQNTSNATATQVAAGSFVRVTQIG